MSAARRWGFTGLASGVLVALGVWCLYQAGLLRAWDGIFYDRALSWTARSRERDPQVVLVRLSQESQLVSLEPAKVFDLLQRSEARAVVLNFVPSSASREFFDRAAAKGIVFGRHLRPDPNDPEKLVLEAWPPAAGNLAVEWGVVHLPPAVLGIHREQQAHVLFETNLLPTLEYRAATLAGAANATRVQRPFLVNFQGRPGRIPNVSWSQFAAGELIPEMARGKVVLIGVGESIPGLQTPVSRAWDRMSLLEYQGSALQTLLDRCPVRPLPGLLLLVLLMGLAIGGALACQRVTPAAGLRVVLVIVAASGATTALAMSLAEIWVPFGSLMLAQAVQFGVLLVLKSRTANAALNEVRLHALNQIKERFRAPEAELSSAQWDRLAQVLHQALDIRRMVFLERAGRSLELREAKSFNCGFEDVQEPSRSMSSAVFSQVLARETPLRAQGFFTAATPAEEEYLCPLVFAGEPLGVWALTLDPAKAAANPQLESALKRFSLQVARALYHRNQKQSRRQFGARFKAWFATENEDQTYRELRRTADVLEQYYDVLDAVFTQVGTAMIVYDFFGEPLKANELAEGLLRAENLQAARASALDFLSLVTGGNHAQVRHLLRNALVDQAAASLAAKLPAQRDRQFLLRVFPLTGRAASAAEPATVRGIVCELIEITSLSTLASIKGLVADRLGVELRDHLAAIEMSASVLENGAVSEAERRTMLEIIHEKTDVCVHVISECQKFLGRDVDAHTIHCFPVDALELLEQACSEAEREASERLVLFNIQRPRLMAQVLASTRDLSRIFSTVLALLLKDAAENTALTIAIEDASDHAVFKFSNVGFGIPNERLQEILASPEVPASEEFQLLRKALVWVRNWGGTLDLTSAVGQGYTLELRLRQFQFSPLSASAAPRP